MGWIENSLRYVGTKIQLFWTKSLCLAPLQRTITFRPIIWVLTVGLAVLLSLGGLKPSTGGGNSGRFFINKLLQIYIKLHFRHSVWKSPKWLTISFCRKWYFCFLYPCYISLSGILHQSVRGQLWPCLVQLGFSIPCQTHSNSLLIGSWLLLTMDTFLSSPTVRPQFRAFIWSYRSMEYSTNAFLQKRKLR